MNVGETASFPIEKMKSVRTIACELGAILDRQFTTKTNRVDRTISISRIN